MASKFLQLQGPFRNGVDLVKEIKEQLHYNSFKIVHFGIFTKGNQVNAEEEDFNVMLKVQMNAVDDLKTIEISKKINNEISQGIIEYDNIVLESTGHLYISQNNKQSMILNDYSFANFTIEKTGGK